jgi:serine/threonine protein kinase
MLRVQAPTTADGFKLSRGAARAAQCFLPPPATYRALFLKLTLVPAEAGGSLQEEPVEQLGFGALCGQRGEYELVERLKTGGMAEVYRARVRGIAGFERTVAIKRMRPELTRDSLYVEMFLDEAMIASQLDHPNIVKTLDLGFADGSYFIVMEYLPGIDADILLRRCRDTRVSIPPRHACFIVAEICDALSYAHSRHEAGRSLEIVHRDVSPHNVLICESGDVKLIDFGVAKASQRRAFTRMGTVKGKVPYLAPEQVAGKPSDWRTDIFAAGALLWELLTGERLFQGATEWDIFDQIQRCDIVPPSQHNPGVAAALDAAVLNALERDPDDRYRDAREFRDRLCEYMESAGQQSNSRALATWIDRVGSDHPARFPDAPTSLMPPPASRRASSPGRTTNKHVIRRAARASTSPPAGAEADTDDQAHVHIASEPPGAEVHLLSGGVPRRLGRTPVDAYLPRSALHQVSIHKNGFETWRGTLMIGSRSSLSVAPRLQPATGDTDLDFMACG